MTALTTSAEPLAQEKRLRKVESNATWRNGIVTIATNLRKDLNEREAAVLRQITNYCISRGKTVVGKFAYYWKAVDSSLAEIYDKLV